MTTTKLMRAAGLCALVAGVLFMLPQFIHPEDEVAQVTTTKRGPHYETRGIVLAPGSLPSPHPTRGENA